VTWVSCRCLVEAPHQCEYPNQLSASGRMEQDDSPGKSGSGSRLKSYKYKGLDAREMRRQREEEGVQLRKQKKDELVSN